MPTLVRVCAYVLALPLDRRNSGLGAPSLLLEDGFFILLEDNSKILLEA